MLMRRIMPLAVTSLVTVASLTGAVSASAATSATVRPDFGVVVTGYGATLAQAETDATHQIAGNYGGCTVPYYLAGDGQEADGTWWAEYSTWCTSYN